MAEQTPAARARALRLATEPGERAREQNESVAAWLAGALAHGSSADRPREARHQTTARESRRFGRHLGNLRGRGFHG